MNLEDAEDRHRSLVVPCRYCPAKAGQVCVRRTADGTWVELERVAAHTPRLADAGVIHAPLLTRELRGD